jgi:hypothetical protein
MHVNRTVSGQYNQRGVLYLSFWPAPKVASDLEKQDCSHE